MNRSRCNSCKTFVPARRVEREGKVYLVKDCPECGPSETLVSTDAGRHLGKRGLDPGYDYRGCGQVKCHRCGRHRRPRYAFIDVTNRCNLNCPMCVDNVGSHGFAFEPPLAYFGRIFQHLAQFEPLPTLALFGGEPTVRDDLLDIIALARSYGFNTRVLTNGVRLADADYCRRLMESRAHLLVSYDGCKPAVYAQLRRQERVLEKKLQAVENIGSMRRGRVSYVTCLAWGLNHNELPDILAFCHGQRHLLRGLYLMPLVQTWESDEFDYEPERMTSEDVERLVDAVFPDETVQFISLGLASHFVTLAGYFGRSPMPYYGGHPNCESLCLLVSDGERYIPIEHYLRASLPEVAGAFLELEERCAAREERWERSWFGRALGGLRLRKWALRQLGRGQALWLALRRVRLGRLFQGRGVGKVGHALAMLAGLAVGRKSRALRERHMRFQDVLSVVVLPLEDDPILETERLERCPSVHVYIDPATDEFRYVPVCSWRLYNKQILRELAEAHGAERREEEAVGASQVGVSSP